MARKVLVEENDARKIYAIACDDGSLAIQFRYLDGNGHVFHAYSENVSAHGVMVLRAELDRAAELRNEADTGGQDGADKYCPHCDHTPCLGQFDASDA